MGDVTIGDGAFAYRMNAVWAKLPPGHAFGTTHDRHVDATGSIYLVEWSSEGTGKVTKFERV